MAKTTTKKPRAKKPGKAVTKAVDAAAAAFYAPVTMMGELTKQLQLQAQQLDQISNTIELLAVLLKARFRPELLTPGSAPLLTEPAPVSAPLLTETKQ